MDWEHTLQNNTEISSLFSILHWNCFVVFGAFFQKKKIPSALFFTRTVYLSFENCTILIGRIFTHESTKPFYSKHSISFHSRKCEIESQFPFWDVCISLSIHSTFFSKRKRREIQIVSFFRLINDVTNDNSEKNRTANDKEEIDTRQ